jgi:hypothetical protein
MMVYISDIVVIHIDVKIFFKALPDAVAIGFFIVLSIMRNDRQNLHLGCPTCTLWLWHWRSSIVFKIIELFIIYELVKYPHSSLIIAKMENRT